MDSIPQEVLDFLGGTVCRPQPNELGRLPLDNTALLKVRVFGNDGVPIILSELPNARIVRAPQSAGVNMGGPWIHISENSGQASRQVFIEEKPLENPERSELTRIIVPRENLEWLDLFLIALAW